MKPAQRSTSVIEQRQVIWAERVGRASPRPGYVESPNANLFLGQLNPETRAEFESGDGGELGSVGKRPPKMSSLLSSSALAVNFFDPWRHEPKDRLNAALGLASPVVSLEFEHRCKRYPVRPRSPNLDLKLQLADGAHIGIESKFVEPYRDAGEHGALSPKYHPDGAGLWSAVGMSGAQEIADRMQAEWTYLDVPQLLKHLLGLRSERPAAVARLIYLWYDTGMEDAREHAREAERFRDEVNGPAVQFSPMTYQQLFAALDGASPDAHSNWSEWMSGRYFA